jgi:FMN-dependent NADH-azoreductase
MTNYQEKTNQSVQELELISERIAAITKELQNHPEDKDDYKNALEVIVILLNQVIGKLSDQK